MRGRNSTIAICALLTIGFATAASVQKTQKLPPVRFWVGAGIAFTGFSIMNDLRSPLGPAFAVVFTTSAIIFYADDAAKLFGARLGADPKEKTSATAATVGTIGADIGGGILRTVRDITGSERRQRG